MNGMPLAGVKMQPVGAQQLQGPPKLLPDSPRRRSSGSATHAYGRHLIAVVGVRPPQPVEKFYKNLFEPNRGYT